MATAAKMRAPDAGSFTDVLKLYYPHFSKATLESMVNEAREGIELIDRRHWIASAKGTYAERLKLAFERSDKDGSGGLSMAEFIAAVKATGVKPPATVDGRPAPRDRDELLHQVFVSADANGDGMVSCSPEPWP